MALITIGPGESRQITFSASSASRPAVVQYLIANLDETATIFIGPADADRQEPDLTSPLAQSQLVALQSVAVSAAQDWYAYNPGAGSFSDVFGDVFSDTPITLDVIPNCNYWAPSPYQAALQLIDQGLMKDSTGQSILGSATSTAANTGTALTQGVPPGVMNVQGFGVFQVGPAGSGVFETFGQPGRIWAAHLSFALTGDASNTAPVQAYAELELIPGTNLAVVELAVSGPNVADSGDAELTMPGLAVNTGDELSLNVNGGSSITNCSMRASCVVLVSFP